MAGRLTVQFDNHRPALLYAPDWLAKKLESRGS
jgi:hypothetical protein